MAKFEDVVEDTTPIKKEVQPEAKTPDVFNTTDPNYYEILGLPSKMKFYPEGTKLYGRPLKVLEIKQLAAINEDNADSVINSILRRTIKGINIDELLSVDKLFLVFWSRSNTFRSSGFSLNYSCQHCKSESKYDFELSKLEVKEVADDFTSDKLKFKLLISTDEFEICFPRVRDERVAEEFKNNHANTIRELDSDIVALATLIKKINGLVMNTLDKYHYISSMNPEDYAYLLTYIDSINFGVQPFVTVDCGSCGRSGITPVIFSGAFFLPEYNLKGHMGN